MAESTNPRAGSVSGTVMTSVAAAPKPFGLGLRRDHHRHRLVGLVYRHFLGHVTGVGAPQTGPAHEDQRLARQVDVLLVLGRIRGDRPVTQLRQLDPDL